MSQIKFTDIYMFKMEFLIRRLST